MIIITIFLHYYYVNVCR